MKRIKKTGYVVILIVFVGFFAGCELLGLMDRIEPPDWIIGTWSDEFGINVYTFTSDNIRFVAEGLGSVDFAEAYDRARIDQDNSTSRYELTVRDAGESVTFLWERKSSTALNYSLTLDGVTIGPIELMKQ